MTKRGWTILYILLILAIPASAMSQAGGSSSALGVPPGTSGSPYPASPGMSPPAPGALSSERSGAVSSPESRYPGGIPQYPGGSVGTGRGIPPAGSVYPGDSRYPGQRPGSALGTGRSGSLSGDTGSSIDSGGRPYIPGRSASRPVLPGSPSTRTPGDGSRGGISSD
jgi:hypothetical protein